MLSSEQVQKIKDHLLKQLDNFPENQRDLVKNKVLSMTNEEIEEFLKENGLDHFNEEEQEKQCIFCAITEKKLKSFIIDENEDNLAILEINPLTKGHSLILPKKHTPLDKLSEKEIAFAKTISEKISKRFKPKEVKIGKNEILGHGIIELIPNYGEKEERRKASEEELTSLLEEIKKVEEKKEITPIKSEVTSPLPNEVKEKKQEVILPKIRLRIP